MSTSRIIAAVAIGSLLLPATLTAQTPPVRQPPTSAELARAAATAPQPASPATSNISSTYRISSGDALEVYVWGDERLQRVLTVLPDGTFALPLAGTVLAAGKTPNQVEAELSRLLAPQYKGIAPQVTVSVKQTSGMQVSVIGKVRSPGSFSPIRYLTLIDILALAGGPTDFADVNNIVILRHEGNRSMVLRSKVGGMLKGRPSDVDLTGAGNPQLLAGDTVVVPLMRRSILVGALLASATLAGAGRAASTQFAGTLDLRAGYGSNPYLSATGSPGSVLLGGTLSAGLTSLTARSSTLLSGSVDIEQNLKHYGRNENYTAALTRSQQLTQRLTINGSLGYANTINPGTSYQNSLNSGALFQNNVVTTPVDPAAGNVATVPAAPVSTALATFNPANLDLFTLGQRSQRYSAGGGLTWTPTARDQFSLSGNASRTKYNRIIGNYDQFAASASLLHAISDKTRVGLSGSYSLVDSVDYPTAESYGLNLLLVQQLSARWSLNAAVGGLLPRGGVGQSSQLTLGFNVSLCGDYGRSRVCFTGSRQSAPTGIGGLRTDLQGGFTLSYELTEHDHLNAGATFDHSGAGSGSTSVLAKQDYYQASGGFSHDVSNRIAVGGSGRYQKRTGGGFFGSASGYAVTVDVITRFGHVAR